MYYGTTYLGEVTHKWRQSGLDVSFIESSHYSTGRMLSSTGAFVTHRGSAVSGETVYMYGANGLQVGEVTDTYISGYWSSETEGTIYHEGLFATSCVPLSGDSGAAVLTKRSDGNYKIVGLVVGKYNDQTEGAVCPWNTIENTYDILPTT